MSPSLVWSMWAIAVAASLASTAMAGSVGLGDFLDGAVSAICSFGFFTAASNAVMIAKKRPPKRTQNEKAPVVKAGASGFCEPVFWRKRFAAGDALVLPVVDQAGQSRLSLGLHSRVPPPALVGGCVLTLRMDNF